MKTQNPTYAEMLLKNKELASGLIGTPYKITVLSNIVTFQITDILEYSLRSESIPAHVQCGGYDTMIQDSQNCQNANLAIVFWELANCIDGLQYKANVLSDSELTELREKIKAEIDLLMAHLNHVPLVLFNTFSTLIFNGCFIGNTPFDTLCDELNEYIKTAKPHNTLLIDINKVIAQTGINQSIDLRYYYSSKALYTIDFYRNYAEFILPAIKAVNGQTKKALIFDCDNTLWHGTIGEDGGEGIEHTAHTPHGVVYEEVQSLAQYLNRQGTIIGLCSKNNPDDVENILEENPDMVLKNRHISIKKINWLDKASNVLQIANDLNIGTESLVMIDDSPFELEYIAQTIPSVTGVLVPEKRHLYPQIFRKTMRHFFSHFSTAEDYSKTEQYAQQRLRNQVKASFSSLEGYLASLQLSIMIHEDNPSIIPRIAQLTQKTNQFNLTTNRYTENDIFRFIADPLHTIYTCTVQDRFGNSGITGLCIIKTDADKHRAVIDSFMLSCRVIGRTVEYAFLDAIVSLQKNHGITTIQASYRETAKNRQVKDFYRHCGWMLAEHNDDSAIYLLELKNYTSFKPNYIEVHYAGKN